MLPDTTGRFSLMQINDSDGVRPGMTSSQIQAEAPHYDAVWGAFSPQTWNGGHPGMYVSRYILPNEDVKQISGHDLSWFQTNHPDWILYACQPDGTPTHELAYFYAGFGDVPLDIHNPDVIAYQIQQLVGPSMIQNGYNTLAADNVEFDNYSTGPNPEFGEGSPQSGWYGCGIWQNGTFVRRYSTGHLQADPAWTADTLNWVQTVHNLLNTDPTLAPHHFKFIVNHPPYSSAPDANETQMLQNVDGMLDENGFTHYGQLYTGSQFMNTLNWMQYTQSHHVAIWITDYFCAGSSCSTDPSTLTPSQVDWALATYAIGNNGGAGVFISPKGGAIYTYRSEYATAYGTPCGAYKQSGSLVFRQFSQGFAVANSGTSAQSLPLPAGHTYTDVEGRAVTSPLTVNGTDAYMLTTGSNGCQ